MQQAIISTLPFLGQIVKVITKDGKEYDVQILQALPDNDNVFSIQFSNHSNRNIEETTGNATTTAYNYSKNITFGQQYDKQPYNQEQYNQPHYNQPKYNQEQYNPPHYNHNSMNFNKKYKKLKNNINHKNVDYKNGGTSIRLSDVIKPFELNY